MTDSTKLDRGVYVLEQLRVQFAPDRAGCCINLDGAEDAARAAWIAEATAGGFDVVDVTEAHPDSLGRDEDSIDVLSFPAGAVQVRVGGEAAVLFLGVAGLFTVTARRVC